jgi:hypothetical protein
LILYNINDYNYTFSFTTNNVKAGRKQSFIGGASQSPADPKIEREPPMLGAMLLFIVEGITTSKLQSCPQTYTYELVSNPGTVLSFPSVVSMSKP